MIRHQRVPRSRDYTPKMMIEISVKEPIKDKVDAHNNTVIETDQNHINITRADTLPYQWFWEV